MDKIPKITIQADKGKELQLFLKFLNHPDFPNHRKTILRVFPDLQQSIYDLKDGRMAIKSFIDKFYLEHEVDISLVIEKSIKEMKESQKALIALGKSMDYVWSDDVEYIAMPTILPFSPFGDNIFYFSIFGQVINKEQKNVLLVAIHEISHFIFFEYLKKIEEAERISLSPDVKYYLKESLTAALFNEEPLNTEFKIVDYPGNPELRDIYLLSQSKYKESLINYLRRKYLDNRKNKKSFGEFLTEIILEFNNVTDEFSKKRKMWNLYGDKIFKNKIILADYQKPIETK